MNNLNQTDEFKNGLRMRVNHCLALVTQTSNPAEKLELLGKADAFNEVLEMIRRRDLQLMLTPEQVEKERRIEAAMSMTKVDPEKIISQLSEIGDEVEPGRKVGLSIFPMEGKYVTEEDKKFNRE